MKRFNRIEEAKMSGINGGGVFAAVATGFSLVSGTALGAGLAIAKNKSNLKN